MDSCHPNPQGGPPGEAQGLLLIKPEGVRMALGLGTRFPGSVRLSEKLFPPAGGSTPVYWILVCDPVWV